MKKQSILLRLSEDLHNRLLRKIEIDNKNKTEYLRDLIDKDTKMLKERDEREENLRIAKSILNSNDSNIFIEADFDVEDYIKEPQNAEQDLSWLDEVGEII